MKNKSIALLIISVLILYITGCEQKEKTIPQEGLNISEAKGELVSNTLTEEQKQEGWKLLFDGKSTEGWRKVYGEDFPSAGWVVENGALIVLASNGRHGGGSGSIVTTGKYSDFELQLDFKLTEGANSGIKYFVVENPGFFKDDPEGPSGRGIGLEYQILDDENHPDAKNGVNGNRTVASLYDLIPAGNDKKVNPIGEWNHVRLISQDNYIEHWLNGDKVLEYERGSDSYQALVDKSKYNVYENFGQEPEGHILLQDHGNRVAFRNIRIRELE